MSGGRKVLPGDKIDGNARESLVKLLHGHLHKALGRVIDAGVISLEAIQNHKMVEVPMDDAGEHALFADGLGRAAETLHLKAISLGRESDVFGVGAVPGNPAVCPYLLQGNPFVIIRHYHRQGRSAAFQRFKLHHHGHLRYPFGNGGFDIHILSSHTYSL